MSAPKAPAQSAVALVKALDQRPPVGEEFAALRELRRLAKHRRTWAYRKGLPRDRGPR